MNDTLRDQLLGLGFKPAPEPERRPAKKRDASPERKGGNAGADRGGEKPGNQSTPARAANAPGKRRGQARTAQTRPPRGAARSREDIDLAKAYAIRAQREKDERIAAEKAKQDAARERREARAKLNQLVQGKALNSADADIARHFEYGGKIKRIHVTAEQLKALNAGELGVLQADGRYLLVDAALLAEAEQVFAPAVALKVDPDAPAADDPYADPQYQVPDDLVW
ncbi:DUF2058 family protein [Lysobacter sp. A03]|uniref:DUF2058 family protein n=1 Tax=Lysobacter sp. A03 TaxID=1199154 RepID=UPI0005B74715|nr:DUF2058 family protein [Lysobacter sp. A03]KIQ95928.1 Nucleoprotein/polynucleotide-associated enzyme [Lysobacter sp. A03]